MERQMNAIIRFTSSPTSPSSPTTTTFVQAETNTFKDLVQKLTGLAGDSEKLPVTLPARLSSKPSHPVDPTGPRRSSFKLRQRRHSMKKLEIKLSPSPNTSRRDSPSSFSILPRQTHCVDSPIPSPVTPLGSESLFFTSPLTEAPPTPDVTEEEKAIVEKGFYLYPSPLSTPRGTTDPPELLTLFPLSSPFQSKD